MIVSKGCIVLANTKKGFIPNAIKWFTGSVFSHSLITFPDILGTPMCMEAADGGVDMLRFDVGYVNNDNIGYEVWSISIPDELKDAALKEMLNNLEVTYGFLAYPWFIWRKICRFFGKDIKSQNNWLHQGIICSQLCTMYLKACGLSHVFSGYGDGSIAPQDLQDIFNSNPNLFQKVESVRL